jgi:uncharacterized protein YndB with AHSA1/START domain
MTEVSGQAISKFVYVTYIRTTAEKLWQALTEPEFTRQYWYGMHQESEWTAGSSWKLATPSGKIGDAGEVLEADRPRRLVLKWQHQIMAELKAEGLSRATYELEPMGETVKLTVTHEMPVADSKFIAQVSTGWPTILSSLKSLLETGSALEKTGRLPEGF